MTPGRLGAVTLTAIVVYGIVYWLKLFLRMRTDSGLLSIPEKSFLIVLGQLLLKTTWVCTEIEIIIKWTTMAKLFVPHSLMA